MEERLDPKFDTALEELYSYFSDNLAPLLVAGSIEELFSHPEVIATGIRTWVSSHFNALGGRTTVSTLTFHAVRKIHLLGELKLLERAPLEKFLQALEPHLLAVVPPAERESLRVHLARIGESSVAAAGGSSMQLMKPSGGPGGDGLPAAAQPASSDESLSPAMVRGLRRFALMLEHGGAVMPGAPDGAPSGASPPAPPNAAEAAQLLAAALETARNTQELEAYLKRAGIADTGAGAVRALTQSLPGWVIRQGDEVSTYRSASAQAMERLVALTGDPQKSADRFREMVKSAIEQFNEGSLGRALAIFELAQRVVAERAVDAHTANMVLGSAHDMLDSGRLLTLARDVEQRPLLRKVLLFLPAMGPAALLDRVSNEPDRQKRRVQLALLEVHGAAIRELALDRLEESLAMQPRPTNAWWNDRNYVYLLHVIPPPPTALPEREVGYVIKLSTLDNAAPLIRESIICLGQARHERALPTLETRLREVEEQLLQEGGPTLHPAPEMLRFLNLIVTALARSGTSLGRRAVVAHALRGDPRLGDTLGRLAELSGADFSGDSDSLEKLLAALKAAIPMKVFGMTIARDSEKVMLIIRALSATPTPVVREALQDIAKRFADQPFGKLAAETLAGLGAARPGGAATVPAAAVVPAAAAAPRPSGGMAGDLDVFGLPELVQSFSQSEASGQLVVRDRAGKEVATLQLRRGLLVRAQAGHVSDEGAFYLLFERPVQGTFEFTRAPATETTVAGAPAGQQFMPLLMEAMRRYDELQRAAAIVGDHVRLKPTGAKPTALPEESDGVFVREMWTKVKGGTTAAECERVIAADPYRIRVLLAYWLEEGVVAVEHLR